MKPRLTRKWGIWMCKRQNEHAPRGYGYTPKAAFDDWLAECWRTAPTMEVVYRIWKKAAT
jgi:hypothetical protein